MKKIRKPSSTPLRGQIIIKKDTYCTGKIHIPGFFESVVYTARKPWDELRRGEVVRLDEVDPPEMYQLIYRSSTKEDDLEHYFYRFHYFDLHAFSKEESIRNSALGTATFRSFHKIAVPQKAVDVHLFELTLAEELKWELTPPENDE